MKNVSFSILGILTAMVFTGVSRGDEEADVGAWVKKKGGYFNKAIAPTIPASAMLSKTTTDADLKHFVTLAQKLEIQLNLLPCDQITNAGLKELVGRQNITSLLMPPGATGEGIKMVATGLPQLEMIMLPLGTRNEDINQLVQLKKLNHLRFSAPNEITDDCWKEIAKLGGLEELYLSNVMKVKGIGIKQLAGLKKLRSLNLDSTSVGDDAASEVGKLKSLEKLSLWLVPITDAGMKHLTGLDELRDLQLYGTKVGDVGAAHIAGMKKIVELDLRYTLLTDTGLKALTELKSLKTLFVYKTGVTEAGAAAFQKARPDCRLVMG